MFRKLLTAAFVVSLTAQSFAAATPASGGEGECLSGCCRRTRANESDAGLARLCCALNCQAPGETNASPVTHMNLSKQHVHWLHGSHGSTERLPKTVAKSSFASLNSLTRGSIPIYLAIHAFLI